MIDEYSPRTVSIFDYSSDSVEAFLQDANRYKYDTVVCKHVELVKWQDGITLACQSAVFCKTNVFQNHGRRDTFS